MLVAAAVCPQTPLLVPEIAGGAAEELADVREACLRAVAQLWLEKPDQLIVLAAGDATGACEVWCGGTFRRFGVDLAVGGDQHGGDSDNDKAASQPSCGVLVGRWLLEGAMPAGASAPQAWEIGETTEPAECARIGRALADKADRVALLVMGDGSARRTLKAPGYLDERAEPYDDDVARALADADTAGLAALDPHLSAALMAAGRAPWQVLAGAAEAAGVAWRGDLLSYRAPYGVGYFTALWTPAAVPVAEQAQVQARGE